MAERGDNVEGLALFFGHVPEQLEAAGVKVIARDRGKNDLTRDPLKPILSLVYRRTSR